MREGQRLQVAPQPRHQGRIVQQHRPSAPTLTQHGQVFVAPSQVQVTPVQPQRLADPRSGRVNHPEQQDVAALCRRMTEDTLDFLPAQPALRGGVGAGIQGADHPY